MGQLITRLTGGIEKRDVNLDYETYAREGDADYAVDRNGGYLTSELFLPWYNKEYIPQGEYQPSDYDDMEETSGDNRIPTKVSVFEYQHFKMTHV